MSWLPLLLVLAISSIGCGNVLYQRFDKNMWANYIHSNELHLGMSKADVVGIMGEPAIREEGDYSGGHYTTYFYLTHSMDFDGQNSVQGSYSNTVRGGYTPLVFQGNKLIAIGKKEYRALVDRPEVGSLPPSAPTNRGFEGKNW